MPKCPPRRFVVAILVAGCSGTDPDDAGTFQARLTGAASLTFTGPTSAGVVHTTANPQGQFTIRMFKVENGVTRAITIACPGLIAPALGSHSLAPEAGDCTGRYSRFMLEPLTLLEEAASNDGTVHLQRSDEAGTAGTFSFSAVLVQGVDSLGGMGASGSFSTTVAR